MRNNPDALVCFSAGNNNVWINQSQPAGPHKPSIGSQAAAKNCLTIGASGSTRAVKDPRAGETESLDSDQMCQISSRGPTVEGRVKPDVVALGYNIFSACSRHYKAVKSAGPEAFSESCPGVLWKVRSGTSHATPLVSGLAASLRRVMQGKRCQSPPAALLKAVIVNGADKLPNIDIAAQGFGRVNLQASMAILQSPPVMSADVPGTSPLSSGRHHNWRPAQKRRLI